MVINFINRVGHFLELKLEKRTGVFIVLTSFALFFVIGSSVFGISTYSPDSWTYFELSKTIFSDNFYRFTTVRSYFSQEYSASFPFGYPAALAVAQIFFGPHPMVAVGVNSCAALTTIFIIFIISKRISIPSIASLALASSLMLYPGYLDEVFSGRSMPFTILLFLLGCYAHVLKSPFASGILLGFSALFRFDFLIYGIVFQFAAFLSERTRGRLVFFRFLGFIVGVLPWCIYSYIHFGKLWVSDNSWVAISALPAFVLDFPAAPIISGFANPGMWLMRVLNNLLPLINSIGLSTFKFPLLLILFTYLIFNWPRITRDTKNKSLKLVSILSTSLVPYILTGYFDDRYFALYLLLACAILFSTAIEIKVSSLLGISFVGLTLVALLFSISIGAVFVAKGVWHRKRNVQEMNIQSERIEALESCHKLKLDSTYIFMGDSMRLAAKYGALTGRRTALRPSNFDNMSEMERVSYFETMKPYIQIINLMGLQKCPSK